MQKIVFGALRERYLTVTPKIFIIKIRFGNLIRILRIQIKSDI
jgi:hypothetical protein